MSTHTEKKGEGETNRQTDIQTDNETDKQKKKLHKTENMTRKTTWNANQRGKRIFLKRSRKSENNRPIQKLTVKVDDVEWDKRK